MEQELFGFTDVACPVCGKTFVRQSRDWVYQTRRNGEKIYFCSYKCWTTDERERLEKETYQGKRLSIEDRELLSWMIGQRKTSEEISRKLNVSVALVNYYRRRKK